MLKIGNLCVLLDVNTTKFVFFIFALEVSLLLFMNIKFVQMNFGKT